MHFVGVGVSGGEEGALCTLHDARRFRRVLQAPLPHAREDCSEGTPGRCTLLRMDLHRRCGSLREDGPQRHRVRRHAGDRRVYDILRSVAGIEPAEQAEIFKTWNEGDLSSYLIEITAEVLAQVDAKTGKPLVDVIVDAAVRRVPMWTAKAVLDLGSPVSAIAESVFARALSSSEREQREQAQRELPAALIATTGIGAGDPEFVEDVRRALFASSSLRTHRAWTCSPAQARNMVGT